MAVIRQAERIFLPLIVLGELRGGFASVSKESENLEILDRFIVTSRVSVLLPDEASTRYYAKIFADLKSRGLPIPTNDIWIAALCIQNDLTLCSSDAHFGHIRGLRIC